MANVKVKLIGAFDMLKFKNMSKVREKHIQAAPAKEIKAVLPINENAKALHPDFINVVVSEVVSHEALGAKTFILSKEKGGALPYFRAGQYISVKMKIGSSYVSRPYSISSSPKWALQGKYAITVQSNPKGFAADWMLSHLKKGSKLTISSPQGNFFYEELRDCPNVVALAGGSGITPFLSMAYAIRDKIEDFNLTILFGNRDEKNILFKKELEEIAAKTKKVKIVHVLSDEKKDGYEKGFVTSDLVKKYAPSDYSIFVCGPEAMYRFLETELKKLKMPRRLVRFEMLGVTKDVASQKDYPVAVKNKTFEITVIQGPKKHKIQALASEPILVAIERAGIKAPSRCRSGECGWCRSRVLEGTFFTPAENEGRRWADVKSNHIHPCATFPTSNMIIEVPGEYLD